MTLFSTLLNPGCPAADCVSSAFFDVEDLLTNLAFDTMGSFGKDFVQQQQDQNL